MININFIRILSLFALNLMITFNFAQSPEEDVIFRAMNDEMKRNMKDLVYKDFDRPFYISYSVADINYMYVSATLGAIISSYRNHDKSWSSARVMVGDYKLNDENFEGSASLPETDIDGYDLPLENDYLGLRRALWVITNNTYKSAATGYKNKIKTLERSNLDPSDLEIDDFSKVPIIIKIDTTPPLQPDLHKFEGMIRELSSIFLEYPHIIDSEVSLSCTFASSYFANTEGIMVRVPLQLCSLTAWAQTMTSTGEIISNRISYTGNFPDELPSVKAVESDIQLLARNLSDLKNAEPLNENYLGPVLAVGQYGLKTVYDKLFTGTNSLVAYREPLIDGHQESMYYGEKLNEFETKFNKRVISDDLSVISMPKVTKNFGKKVIGEFEVDAEGVIPEEKLVLIEDGILKNLLNDRTPTRMVKNSNGYNRFSIGPGYISKKIAPGIVEIISKNNSPFDELKSILLKEAMDEGFDYAIIIRPLKISADQFPVNIYKADVETGEETLVRSAYISNTPENLLRKVLAFSDTQMVYNFTTGNGRGGFSSGVPVSVIGPDAFVFEEIKVENTVTPLTGREPKVKNPLEIN